jgi:hypothetical protein
VLAQDGGALLPARATDTGRPVLEREKEGETGARASPSSDATYFVSPVSFVR